MIQSRESPNWVAPFIVSWRNILSFEIPGLETDEQAALDEATAPDTFNVFDFVKKTNTPTLTVTIYTDADAALKLYDLKQKQGALEQKNKDLAEVFDITDDTDFTYEIDELLEQINETALKFTVKGLAPKALDAFNKSFEAKNGDLKDSDQEAYNVSFNNSLVAKSLVSFETPDGQVIDRKWTADEVAQLTEDLYISEASKLYSTTARANYVGAVFDAAVSADFS